jgi:hypothetical protein
VVYADPDRSRELAALAYEELGRVDDGVWVACPDQTVRVLAERRPPLFLYFDRHGYEVAVATLSPTQIQEVIRRRRDRWVPQASSYIISWLFDLERVALEGALLSTEQGGPRLTPEVEQSLSLLQRLAGLDRYQRVPAKALAVTVLEGESLLLAIIGSALATGLQEGSEELAWHLQHRQLWAKAVSQVVVLLGAPEFANALPFATPAHGVYAHPVDEEFRAALLQSKEPVVPWRDGLVYVTTEHRLAEQPAANRSVDVLYHDASEFYDSVEQLTTAQLQRDFSARLGRSAEAAGRAMQGQIDRLQLHQLLLKRELCQRSDAARACQSLAFDSQLREESSLLARSLARTHTFSSTQGFDSASAPALRRAAHETVTADLSLFAALAQRYWPAIAPELKQIETKRH